MKKIIILASALLLLASCKKEADICGDSTFDFKLYGSPTKLITYVNGSLIGEFGNEVSFTAPAGVYYIGIIQQRNVNNSTLIFSDTVVLEPCKDIFSYKY
jgi:hypothetical protein